MSNWTCLVKHKWNTLLLFPSFNFSSQVLHKSCKMKQDLRSSWKFTDYTSRWMSSKQQQQITESNKIALLKTGLNYNVNLTWDRGTCESLIEVCNTCFQKRSLEWNSPFLFVRMAWRRRIDKSNTTSCSDNTDHTQKNYNSWWPLQKNLL